MLSFQRKNVEKKSYNIDTLPHFWDVEDFIYASKEYQTFMGQLEGEFIKTCIKANGCESEIEVKSFIKNVLCSVINSNEELEKAENDCVQKVSGTVISQSSEFLCDEIRLSAVWVCFWDHSKKNTLCIPLIKVFKSTIDSHGAIFINSQCQVFVNWDHFLDTAELPTCFLCVPRHGNYNFIDGKLDLEYICFERQSREIRQETVPRLPDCNQTRNFYNLIQPWLRKICDVIHSLTNTISEMPVKNILEILLECKSIITACVLKDWKSLLGHSQNLCILFGENIQITSNHTILGSLKIPNIVFKLLPLTILLVTHIIEIVRSNEENKIPAFHMVHQDVMAIIRCFQDFK